VAQLAQLSGQIAEVAQARTRSTPDQRGHHRAHGWRSGARTGGEPADDVVQA
jgi:hypothetical protein